MEFSTALSILALLFSLFGWLLATVAIAFVIGLKNSTHSIQWIPAEIPQEKQKETEASVHKLFGNNKEDLEDYLTPFSHEKDLKKNSIFDDGEIL